MIVRTADPSPIRIAVIGLGWVGENRHIPAILQHPGLTLCGVVDPHPDRARRLAKKLKILYHAQTDRLSSVPWLDEVDAVTLCTPPWTHHDLTLQALQRGKHVLTEKPFAMSLDEADSMCETATRLGKTLAVMHNFQFGRAMAKLEKDMTHNRLGTIRRVAACQLGNPKRRLPEWHDSLPLGLFFDESPHFFYLLKRLTGENLSLQHAHGIPDNTGGGTPRLVQLLYKAGKGFPLTIDCQFDSAISEWFVLVNGEKAAGLIDLFRDIYIRIPNDGAHGLRDVLRTSLHVFLSHFLQHVPNGLSFLRGTLDYGNAEVYTRFIRSIRTGIEDDKIGFTQARAVLKLQLQAIERLQDNI